MVISLVLGVLLGIKSGFWVGEICSISGLNTGIWSKELLIWCDRRLGLQTRFCRYRVTATRVRGGCWELVWLIFSHEILPHSIVVLLVLVFEVG